MLGDRRQRGDVALGKPVGPSAALSSLPSVAQVSGVHSEGALTRIKALLVATPLSGCDTAASQSVLASERERGDDGIQEGLGEAKRVQFNTEFDTEN